MRTEITTMIMIRDGKKALVINRKKKYPGISFPGGHVEPGESFYDCAVREAYEETGLTVSELKLSGIINWAKKNGDRYIEFLYKTSSFSGSLSDGTDEGEIKWVNYSDIPSMRLSSNFEHYLKIYDTSFPVEAFGEWTDDGSFNGLMLL